MGPMSARTTPSTSSPTPQPTILRKASRIRSAGTKLTIAVELVCRAGQAHIPFRAVLADSFYGEDRGVKQGLRDLGAGYVLALPGLACVVASSQSDWLLPGSGTGCQVEPP